MVSIWIILRISICSFDCSLYFCNTYMCGKWPGLCISCKVFHSTNWISFMTEYPFQILQNSVWYMKIDEFIWRIQGQLHYRIFHLHIKHHYNLFPIMYFTGAESFSNCTQSTAVSLPCSVHNFKIIHQIDFIHEYNSTKFVFKIYLRVVVIYCHSILAVTRNHIILDFFPWSQLPNAHGK